MTKPRFHKTLLSARLARRWHEGMPPLMRRHAIRPAPPLLLDAGRAIAKPHVAIRQMSRRINTTASPPSRRRSPVDAVAHGPAAAHFGARRRADFARRQAAGAADGWSPPPCGDKTPAHDDDAPGRAVADGVDGAITFDGGMMARRDAEREAARRRREHAMPKAPMATREARRWRKTATLASSRRRSFRRRHGRRQPWRADGRRRHRADAPMTAR